MHLIGVTGLIIVQSSDIRNLFLCKLAHSFSPLYPVVQLYGQVKAVAAVASIGQRRKTVQVEFAPPLPLSTSPLLSYLSRLCPSNASSHHAQDDVTISMDTSSFSSSTGHSMQSFYDSRPADFF